MSAGHGAPQTPHEFMLDTDDGWSIQLLRYPAPDGRGDPVLFVHGMGANHHNFDLNRRHSLARFAAARGCDSWVVELRGRGQSRGNQGDRQDWNFEDFLHRDLRAAVACIRAATSRPVHWVGHSMGGILGLAYVECYGRGDVSSLVLFGTPLAFDPGQWMLKLWGMVVQVHRVLPTFDQETWGRRMLPLMQRNRKALDFFLRYLANPKNVDTQTTLDLFDKLVTNEAPGIILQFSAWVRCGQIRSCDLVTSYTGELGKVEVPVLFVSGAKDLMAPAEVTRRHMRRLGSAVVEQLVLSRRHGFTADYGHGDLIMGRRAPEEVYPRVVDWIGRVGAT